MPGIIVYTTKEPYCCHSLDFFDKETYSSAKGHIRANGDKILWKKGNISVEQIKNAKEKVKNLVRKFNLSEKVDLERELPSLFE